MKERKKILYNISFTVKKNISIVNEIYFNNKCKIGNCLVFLNKALFFCELIKCKKIILNKKIYWFIKNKINIKKYNITIFSEYYRNIKKNKEIIIYNSNNIFYMFFNLKPEIRIFYLRKEIINNLPKIKLSRNYLYIHIRSGDIFKFTPNIGYSQPPLCFYEKIINSFNFERIYLICLNKNNPVIQSLINEYPNLIYRNNNLLTDIAILINAYNIVSSISSFLNSIIQLNYNLNYIWDYNIMKAYQKIIFYHYDLYKFPQKQLTIFRMESSQNYKNIMFVWKNNKKQRKLMIKERCYNYFKILKN